MIYVAFKGRLGRASDGANSEALAVNASANPLASSSVRLRGGTGKTKRETQAESIEGMKHIGSQPSTGHDRCLAPARFAPSKLTVTDGSGGA